MTQSNTTMDDSKRWQLSKDKMKSKYAREPGICDEKHDGWKKVNQKIPSWERSHIRLAVRDFLSRWFSELHQVGYVNFQEGYIPQMGGIFNADVSR